VEEELCGVDLERKSEEEEWGDGIKAHSKTTTLGGENAGGGTSRKLKEAENKYTRSHMRASQNGKPVATEVNVMTGDTSRTPPPSLLHTHLRLCEGGKRSAADGAQRLRVGAVAPSCEGLHQRRSLGVGLGLLLQELVQEGGQRVVPEWVPVIDDLCTRGGRGGRREDTLNHIWVNETDGSGTQGGIQ